MEKKFDMGYKLVEFERIPNYLPNNEQNWTKFVNLNLKFGFRSE